MMKRATILGRLFTIVVGSFLALRITAVGADPALAPIAALALNAGVPCVCPQFPIGTNMGQTVYYAEEYFAGDTECLYPSATVYQGNDAEDWPYICDQCLSSARREARAERAFEGLSEKMRWNGSPEFPTQAARDSARLVNEDFVEFRNPLTKKYHRAKLFLYKVDPRAAGERRGDPRFIAVGFEVEESERSAPTFHVSEPKRVRQVSNDSKHAFRLQLGATHYLVLLAKD